MAFDVEFNDCSNAPVNRSAKVESSHSRFIPMRRNGTYKDMERYIIFTKLKSINMYHLKVK
jgi:hypothetical protein